MRSASRRDFLQLAGAAWLALGVPSRASAAQRCPATAQLADLERSAGGRLGAAILDTGTGALLAHRGDERFGFCSTFKLLLAALVLREVDLGRVRLDTELTLPKTNALFHSPVTNEHLPRGRMTVAALAEAAQTQSDNLAANLLVGLVGGTAGFTQRLRALGDDVTRLDRYQTELNYVLAGELRDTTTPGAMARVAARMLTTDFLSPASRALLIRWMRETQTGLRRLRAGWPADWRAGDKTGTAIAPGMANKVNDVAIAFPPGRAPIVVVAFYESPTASDEIPPADQAVLAGVGAIAAGCIAPR